MGSFAARIEEIQSAAAGEKVGLLDETLELLRRLGGHLLPEDRQELEEFVLGQLRTLNWEVPQTEDEKKKDLLLECGIVTVDILKALAVGEMPGERTLNEALRFKEILCGERAIETALADVVGRPDASAADAQKAVDLALAEQDEFRRSLFWQAFSSAEKGKEPLLSPAAKEVICAYANGELSRFAAMDAPPQDLADAMELAADYCRFFADERTPGCLRAAMEKGFPNVDYFAAETLFELGEDVPQTALDALAADGEYAAMTWKMVRRFCVTERFPASCREEVHLAASDLCHWLTYPTELGERPEAMEFLGRTKKLFRKNEYFVFRFRSRSANLEPEERGNWLIGWSSEGDTWSEYDFYEDYAGDTPEETLRNIRRKVL